MKKVIAVLIALAMVLSMSVMAFAEYNGVKSPADIATSQEEYDEAVDATWQLDDPVNWFTIIERRQAMSDAGIYTKDDGSFMYWADAWKAYCAYVASAIPSDAQGATSELINIVQSGYVSAGDVIAVVGQTIMGGIGGDGESGDLSQVISDLIEKLKGVVGGDKEPEVTADQYVEELVTLINGGASFDEVTKKISDDLASGKIVLNQIPDIISILSSKIEAGEIENNETVQKIMEFLKGLGGGEGGFEFPDFGDITPRWDNGNSESGSFLDTILGIIGSIGDIFNPSNPDPDDPSNNGNNGNDTIPDTGDVSFVAVAAVAAVAGAAFVLTRKKSDAE